MLDLDDAGEGFVVGVVDLHGGLKEFLLDGLGLEPEGAIGERAEAAVEVLVDGAGVDHVAVVDERGDLAVIGLKEEFDIGMIEHAAEHGGVAVEGEGLKFFGEITVVAVGADGDAPAGAGVEFARVAFPLLEGVVLEEEPVELVADLGDDDFLGVLRDGDGDAPCGEGVLHLLAGGGATEELLEGVEVDGELPVTTVGPGEDAVIDGAPVGELAEVLDDAVGVGAEVMGAVEVKEDAGGVVGVVGVAADVVAALDDEASPAALGGEALCEDGAGEAGADDEVVDRCH